MSTIPPGDELTADPSSAQPSSKAAARASTSGRLALLILLLLVVPAIWLSIAWKQTARSEAYLPQLEKQAQDSRHNGPLLALVGGLQAQAHDPDAIATLEHAIAAGEKKEIVWQTLAGAHAAMGDVPGAITTLHQGQDALHNVCPVLDAALAKLGDLGTNPDPSQAAAAICPDGPGALAAAYRQGSFLNGLSMWWGRRHPEQSGFATREQWAKDEPHDADAQRLWGVALLLNRRLPEAAATLKQAVTLNPLSTPAHLALGQTLEAQGMSGQAAEEYIQVLKSEPNSLHALLGLGRVSLDAGLNYARPAFLHATRLAPTSARAWIGLGRADLTTEQNEAEALNAFQTAARLAPSRIDFSMDYAQALINGGRMDEAEVLARRALQQAPDDVAGHFQLGHVLSENNPSPTRLAEAEAQTRAALLLSPGTPGIERQLGSILLGEKNNSAAIAILKQAMADDPRDIQSINVLARAYGQAGQIDLASQEAKRAAAMLAVKQQIDLWVSKSKLQFLDVAVHRKLADLYQQSGEDDKVAQEQRTIAEIQQDPANVAKRHAELQHAVQQAFGNDASGIL